MRRRGKYIPEAIVYDGKNSSNYYHHLIDTLPSLALQQEQSDVPQDIPLIVNRWIYESRFFAHLRARSQKFASRNWLIQEPGEWLHVGRAYRMLAAPFDHRYLEVVRNFYGHISEPKGRRVFLSRDPKMFSRGIRNETEVANLLGQYGFETIYAEHLTLQEQQRTFEETTHLVALQGMGLVQQLFMEPGVSHILEIMPLDRLQAEYYWLGWTLGVQFYDVQVGSTMDRQNRYKVDLNRLEAGVKRMLGHPSGKKQYGETILC